MLWKSELDQAGPAYWPLKGFCIPDDDDDDDNDAALPQQGNSVTIAVTTNCPTKPLLQWRLLGEKIENSKCLFSYFTNALN